MSTVNINIKEKEDEKELCSFKIKNISVAEGEAPSILLEIKDYISGGSHDVRLKVDEITPVSLRKVILKNNGLCLEEGKLYERLMEYYCRAVANNLITILRHHKKLGWDTMDGQPVFCGHTIVANNDIQSEYVGDVDVNPKGNIANIVKMINEEILACEEWSPLQAVIAFSAGATILPFAKKIWGIKLNNLIIHLLGNSSSGKSTALRLHTGLGANPEGKKGFWLTHESSLVAVIRRIGDNKGFPVSIDELKKSTSKKDYDSFVYDVGNGEEKDRLGAGGNKFQHAAIFDTVVLSSGEVSILKKCSSAEGVRARSIEIFNEQWTKSKKQANSICQCVSQNYGFLPPLVASELLKNSDEWYARWKEIDGKVQAKIEKDKIFLSIVPRVADFVVLFTLAAEVVNRVLGISLDVDKIFKFAYQYIIVANAEEANLAERAYTYLLEYYSMHKEKFALGEFYGCQTQNNVYMLNDDEEGFVRYANRKRIINGMEYDRQIVFRMSSIERILDEAGFSVKVALSKLKEAKYLQTKGDDRFYAHVTINDVEQKAIILYYKDDAINGIDLDTLD